MRPLRLMLRSPLKLYSVYLAMHDNVDRNMAVMIDTIALILDKIYALRNIVRGILLRNREYKFCPMAAHPFHTSQANNPNVSISSAYDRSMMQLKLT